MILPSITSENANHDVISCQMVTNGDFSLEWYNPSAPLLSGRAQISLCMFNMEVGGIKPIRIFRCNRGPS